MIRTAICEMLGIRYPVFQGGMAWIADGKLAAHFEHTFYIDETQAQILTKVD